MDISFNYRVTFKDGTSADRKDRLYAVVTNDEYRLIVKGLVAGHTFYEIPGIDDIIARLDQQVAYLERHLSINGIFRDEPLRKPRVIVAIEYSLPEHHLKKLLAYRDHMDLLDMPEEEMTIYRADGSYVTIKCLFGEVWLTDSRQSASTHKMSSDRFLSRVI